MFGIAERKAFFVIRQHKVNLAWKPKGKKRRVGKDDRGRWIDEQTVVLTDTESGETSTVRRVTIHLKKPTKDGEMEIHILTNLPAEAADALKVASLYADRWTIETAFQHLTEDLRCEINTLGYPKAALFGFCLALVAYNVVSLVKMGIPYPKNKYTGVYYRHVGKFFRWMTANNLPLTPTHELFFEYSDASKRTRAIESFIPITKEQ